jgi:hypothetical protein
MTTQFRFQSAFNLVQVEGFFVSSLLAGVTTLPGHGCG